MHARSHCASYLIEAFSIFLASLLRINQSKQLAIKLCPKRLKRNISKLPSAFLAEMAIAYSASIKRAARYGSACAAALKARWRRSNNLRPSYFSKIRRFLADAACAVKLSRNLVSSSSRALASTRLTRAYMSAKWRHEKRLRGKHRRNARRGHGCNRGANARQPSLFLVGRRNAHAAH